MSWVFFLLKVVALEILQAKVSRVKGSSGGHGKKQSLMSSSQISETAYSNALVTTNLRLLGMRQIAPYSSCSC